MIDIAIIGAGPYGLSLSAHLRGRGIDFRIFGEPMESWKNNMPEGMLLKSYPWASNIAHPDGRLTIKKFFGEQKIAYNDTQVPVPLDVFIRYGETFQQRYAPMVERKKLVSLMMERGTFTLRFDNEETVHAKRVVLAIGIIPFAHIPPVACKLPRELISHSSNYGPLDSLEGKKVFIVGSGSSAIDLAAFAHERGIDVSLVIRSDQLNFASAPPERKLFKRILSPDSGIGNGWGLQVCASAPWFVNRLPDAVRNIAAHTKALGPLGGAFMPDRVIGKVPLLSGRAISHVDRRGDKIDLRLTDTDGQYTVFTADHVVFATGFMPINVERLGFLDHSIKVGIKRPNGAKAPDLSPHYESSVPGLHFIGPASMHAFGPVPRFVFGTPHPARHLSRHWGQKQETPYVSNLTPVAAGNRYRE